MANYIAGFIGTGNMGGALAAAACKTDANVLLADHDITKAEALAKQCGCSFGDNAAVAENCRYIFLGVKPQILGAVLAELKPLLAKREERFVLVSMAAGVAIEKIENLLGAAYPVIRIMPNTPCTVGMGVIEYAAWNTSGEKKAAFVSAFSAAGLLDEIPESKIDAASALSGCGPAFVYLFAEALADGAVACGLPREKALLYAAQTLAGAAEMLLTTGEHPGTLKDAVCSPGGSTIEGVRALEDGAFRATAMQAVIASYEKTLKLGKKS